MDDFQLLKHLSEAFGISGFEDAVRERIKDLVTPLVDDVRTDSLGNLIATINPGKEFTLLLDAHMDEIGFMISHVEEKGFLRFAQVGGWDERLLPALRVTLKTREGKQIAGTIGSTPPHIQDPDEKKSPLKPDDLFIDVGAGSREDIEQMGIRVGDPVAPHADFLRLNETCIMSKAFDDRAGCAAIVRALEALSSDRPDFTVVGCFSVCEEVGLRGARTAAFQIQPTVAIAIEGTVAADTPGTADRKNPTRLGKGPAVTLADRSIMVHPKMFRFITETASAMAIPHQIKTPIYGSTDAGAIHLTRKGVITGVISNPCR
ncbi:MAG: M42 family metallopeptidase [Deltaproteobacteria bacterium]|nr:M42 family metallopeptidase [Deltaproteobacteria bacterium]